MNDPFECGLVVALTLLTLFLLYFWKDLPL